MGDNRPWLTYAGNDVEAWKAIVLSRSLKRTISRRDDVVFFSDEVSSTLRALLYSEFNRCHWISSDVEIQLNQQGAKGFRSVAKFLAMNDAKFWPGVFLDCNCLVLRNMDHLFHETGIQFTENFTAVIAPEPNMKKSIVKKLLEDVVSYETFGVKPKEEQVPLPLLDICAELNGLSKEQHPVGGDPIRIVCFSSGHPIDCTLKQQTKGHNQLNGYTGSEWRNEGILESHVFAYVRKLVPELFGEKLTPAVTNTDLLALKDSIAITGMACRYPGANTIDEFWTLLEQGIEGIRRCPDDRWTKNRAFIHMEGTRRSEAGFLSCPVDTFDAKFFNTNSADLAYMDPQQRLSLRVVWEGLEHAGIDPLSLKGSLTGVFGGWWRNDYKEMLQMAGTANQADFLRGYMGNALGPLTARISHFFELIGPAYSTESGCSTSVAGVDMACDSLKNEKCHLAVAVGANLLLHPFVLGGGMMEGVLAPDGRCKTFDASANGFGRAEGIGVLILKRFPDAVENGDKIWGVIRSTAIVQEGTSRSMGTPTVDVEAKAMELALKRANVHPDDVDFFETHGTGTPVGDPIEVLAIAKSYGTGTRPPNKPLIIGSVKTNIGHTESVCGIAGIQKTLLAMHNELIPKHLNVTELSPEINLSVIPAQLPMENIPWKKRKGLPRLAGVDSFGITGAQAHVILQEPPERACLPKPVLPLKDTRNLKMLTFSAKSEKAFWALIQKYEELLLNTKELDLSELERSIHISRPHFGLRATAIGASQEELLQKVRNLLPKSVKNAAPKVCFLFTGQGSQYPGMAKTLYETNVVFRSHFDWCESVLKNDHEMNLKEAIWEKPEFLKRTLYSQVAIFVIEFCLLRLWESWGVKPDAVLGHSLGEFAACIAAGILTPKDALSLVVKRSKLIDALPNAGMIVIGADLNRTKELMLKAFEGSKHWLDIAAINSEDQIVLSGETNAIKHFKDYCTSNDTKAHILDASHAFHSRLLEPILKEYGNFADSIGSKPTKCDYFSSVSGERISGEILNAEYWVRHARNHVRFLEASQAAAKEGYSLFLEIGPHPVLSALTVSNTDSIADDLVCLPSLRKNTLDWDTMVSSLSQLYLLGTSINWKNFHRYAEVRERLLDLPGYQFEETVSWMKIRDDGSLPFHPLLGAYVPSPSQTFLYRNTISLQLIPWLADHAIVDKVIFPCAGYSEMCLTACYAATNCPDGKFSKPTGKPVSIKDFKIITPCILDEKMGTEFQVVVEKDPKDGAVTSTIYTKLELEEGTWKWVKNAQATYNSNVEPPTPEILDFPAIRARCSVPLPEEKYSYDQLRDFSFNFGPGLTSVKKGWVSGPDERLVYFQSLETKETLEPFLAHPWMWDPILQMQIFSYGFDSANDVVSKRMICVPVQYDRLIWWGHSAPSGYVYIKRGTNGYLESHLYDEDGKLMVSLFGTENVVTTLGNVLALIDAQKNPFPSLAEIEWKVTLGPEARRLTVTDLAAVNFEEILDMKDQYQQLSSEEKDSYDKLQELAGLYMLKSVKEMKLGEICPANLANAAEKMGVIDERKGFLRYILLELQKDGWIQLDGNENITIKQQLPPIERIKKEIGFLTEQKESFSDGFEDIKILSQMWEQLPGILTGKVSAQTTPDDGNFSQNSILAHKLQKLADIEGSLLTQLANIGRKSLTDKSVLRILEVGIRTGDITKELVKHMVEAGSSQFEYTYTDIRKQQLFDETGIAAKFAQLDLNEDPLAQGFGPKYYDVIIVSWMLHPTKDMNETLKNFEKLLRPGGYIFLTEPVQPSRDIMLTFGGLEQYLCNITPDFWNNTLSNLGFITCISLTTWEGAIGLVIARAESQLRISCNHNPPDVLKEKYLVFGNTEDPFPAKFMEKLETIYDIRTVSIEDISLDLEADTEKLIAADNLKGVIYLWSVQEGLTTKEACEPFLYICKALNKVSNPLNVLAFTRGQMCTGPSDFDQSDPSTSPIVGMLSVLANENQELKCKCVDIGILSCVEEAFSELFTWDDEAVIAYRDNNRCLPRLHPYRPKSDLLEIPKTERYRLILPPSHMISDLSFAPCEATPLPDNELEVQVKAYCLNFLDTFIVTKPDPLFENYNYVGVDFAGIVARLGTKVEGFDVGQFVTGSRRAGFAMPSHVTVPQTLVCAMPSNFTFLDGASGGLAFVTAAQCMGGVGKATKDDILLIHTASGGVGLWAIQQAQYVGCTIVATAGNKRKRNYLRGLGLQHVFNSRNTNYAEEIRKALGGRGITLVLNSLTGTGFKEATLSLCEPGARFIEMSKMNVWTKEEVKELRPDVFYEIVDVSLLEDEHIRVHMNKGAEHLEEKEIKTQPLPVTRFNCNEVRQALEYMEKVKHIGKIGVTMPEFEGPGSEPIFPVFNKPATYLITGGLGGIGLELAKWMVSKGARNIVLTSRSKPKPEVVSQIESLRSSAKDANIIIRQCDVGDMTALEELFRFLEEDTSYPPVRGIMHAAGLLDDGTWDTQTWQKYENVYNPKVNGGWNLHQISLKLLFPLEHFVVFSSVTSILGSIGQSNYVSANYYLDQLVHYRVSLGLPALTVNWGQWGGIGMAANMAHSVFKPFSVAQGLAALEHALKSHKTQLVAYEADLGALKDALPSAKGLLADIEKAESRAGAIGIDAEEFWKEYDSAETNEEKYEIVRKSIKRLLRNVLRMDANEPIDDHTHFQDMGLDSLMMVEMKNGMQTAMGKRVKISINSVKDCKNVAELSTRLVELISGKPELPPLPKEELYELIKKDWTLDEDFVLSDPMIFSSLTHINEVTTVLLTGATGTLGPYVLQELAALNQIKKIYLLVRPNPLVSVQDRARRSLEQKNLPFPKDIVEIVSGDISKPNLGFDQETYDKLSCEVQAVIHTAGRIALNEHYRESEDPLCCRNVTVLGLKTLLRFCMKGKLKHIYTVSSILTQNNVDKDGQVLEDWPSEDLEHIPDSSYGISKLVAEKLLEQAAARGFPVKAFRLPYIGGESGTGKNANTDSSFMMRLYYFMSTGRILDVKSPVNLMPVNTIAKLSLDIFFSPDSGYEMYNVTNPQTCDESEFASMGEEFGLKLDVLPQQEFYDSLLKVDEGIDFQEFAKIVIPRKREMEKIQETPPPYYTSFTSENRGIYRSKKLERFCPSEYPGKIPSSWDILRKDLQYAKDMGVFDRYKIKYASKQQQI